MNFDSSCKEISIDTETTGLFPHSGDRPWMFSLFNSSYESYCADWYVDPYTRIVDIDTKSESYLLYKEISENSDITKIYFNASFDIMMAEMIGIKTFGNVIDVGIMARIYRTNLMSYKLKHLSKRFLKISDEDEKILQSSVVKLRKEVKSKGLGFRLGLKAEQDYWLTKHVFNIAHSGLDISSFSAADLVELNKIYKSASFYCGMDTARTFLLYKFLEEKIQANANWRKTFEREQKIFPVVLDMHRFGVNIDIEEAKSKEKECLINGYKHIVNIEKMTYEGFNPGSPKQLSNVLYGKEPYSLGLEVLDYTKKKQPSTGYKTLIKYFKDVEFCRELLMFRKYSKGADAFFSTYLRLVDDDGILHPWFNQLGANRTSRMSSNNPNMQQASDPNSSQKKSLVVAAKTPFVMPEGYNWGLYDYKGQELRIFAGLADVAFIKQAVAEGRDLNDELANSVWGGKDNPSAITEAIKILCLFDEDIPDSEVDLLNVWKQFEWSKRSARVNDISGAEKVASAWLDLFDWKITAAEKSLGKKGVRTIVKISVFTLLYGGSWKTLVPIMKTDERAKNFTNDLNRAIPEYKAFKDKITNQIERYGYIINAYGRRIDVEDEFIFKGVNCAIQSTAADMMKEGMISVKKAIKDRDLDFRITIQIHDELVLKQNNEQTTKENVLVMKHAMEQGHEEVVGIPIEVDVNLCRNRWSEEEPFYFI